MATTVTAAFDEFLRRLEPTQNQKDDASTKQSTVKDCIDSTLWVSRAFLTGSYARSTMIRPPSDIDLFVVLDHEKHAADFFHTPDGAVRVLDRFHSILKSCFSTTAIRKDHPAVHLNFSTYGFDVVPAFNRQGGGYLILSRKQSGWTATDPMKHAEQTTALNGLTAGDFVRVVKMLKAWNRAKNYSRLTGFHLEVETSHAWPKDGSDSPAIFFRYATAVAAVLRRLSSTLLARTSDPAGLGGYIDDYLTDDARRWTRERLTAAADGADIALSHEERGRMDFAIAKWRDVLGDDFPGFG
jgi:predicted nucleotidyltransferase